MATIYGNTFNITGAELTALGSEGAGAYISESLKMLEPQIADYCKGELQRLNYPTKICSTFYVNFNYGECKVYVNYPSYGFTFYFTCSDGVGFSSKWPVSVDFDERLADYINEIPVGGSLNIGASPFEPPTPTTPKTIDEVPFYEELKKNS